MSNACALRLVRIVATVITLAWTNCAQLAPAQGLGWQAASNGLMPMLGTESFASPTAGPPAAQRANMNRRAPLAHLIENPDQSDGAPPFALTDQTGTIQRYVEPEPGINLAAHVGQVVVVRHDTGQTLLASQLELPPQTLYPMVGDPLEGDRAPRVGRSFRAPRTASNGSGVEQVQYVDNDDSTVQLLPDDVPLPGGVQATGNIAPLEMIGPGGGYPGYPNQMMPPEMCGPGCNPQGYNPQWCGPQGCNSQCCDPMQCPGGMPPYAEPMMGGPCPNCGRYHNGSGYGPLGVDPSANSADAQRIQFSGDVEFDFLRARITEDVVGKLSDVYQFSPRFILGVHNLGNFDGRVRYWHYGRDTELLSDGSIRLEFDVFDFEMVHRFEGRRAQVALAAGVRLAHLQLTDDDDAKVDSDLFGLTMAADGLTPFTRFSGGYCGWVYGGRISILGGNWGGDDNSAFIDQRVRDDNVLVTELYAGAQIARRVGKFDLHGRLVFEMQNWRSDVLSQEADIGSIGFLGPGLQIGADF